MTRPIEPSDTERAEWPDTTRAYVEYLEAIEGGIGMTVEEYRRVVWKAIEDVQSHSDAIRADERAKVIAEAVALCEDGTDYGYISGGDEQARVLLKHLHTPASRAIAESAP